MTHNTQSSSNDNRPWWQERMVWLIIALPVTAVLASVATYMIASQEPVSMVRAQYTKTGMAIEEQRDAALKAASLGISATLDYRDGAVRIQLHGNAPIAEPQLLLHLVHPTQEGLDQQIPLTQAGEGIYQARVLLAGEGKRQLFLEPPSRDWQLQGLWQAPFIEETSLSAASALNPSTHP
ncbi:MAG: FixH family protein [Pseudomonadota bacterium]